MYDQPAPVHSFDFGSIQQLGETDNLITHLF